MSQGMSASGSGTGQIHASAVSLNGKGCLIVGASGAGKSGLALELLALGAGLIADDQVVLSAADGVLYLAAPDRMRGVIEARHFGLIEVPRVEDPVPCHLVIDLDQASERLPPLRSRDLLGISCPVIFGLNVPGLASAIVVFLRSGRLLDPDQGL